MAYARLSKGGGISPPSDVYVFMHTDGWLECDWCRLMYEDGTEGDRFKAFSTAAMTAHLREHITRGHRVPDYVIPDIEADDAENFPVTEGTPR